MLSVTATSVSFLAVTYHNAHCVQNTDAHLCLVRSCVSFVNSTPSSLSPALTFLSKFFILITIPTHVTRTSIRPPVFTHFLFLSQFFSFLRRARFPLLRPTTSREFTQEWLPSNFSLNFRNTCVQWFFHQNYYNSDLYKRKTLFFSLRIRVTCIIWLWVCESLYCLKNKKMKFDGGANYYPHLRSLLPPITIFQHLSPHKKSTMWNLRSKVHWGSA